MKPTSPIVQLPLSALARAIRVLFMSDSVGVLWGVRGIGKTSLVRQSVPPGWNFYPFMLSDKEGTDIGGNPIPDHKSETVKYYMNGLLPFDKPNEKAVIFIDELDRVIDTSVHNAAQQLILDRSVNGHKLGPNVRIIAAGNGSSDTGTLPLTEAMITRLVHLYVAGDTPEALQSWMDWAKGSGIVSPALQSFAKYRSDVFASGNKSDAFEELAKPSNRGWVEADKIYQAIRKATFATEDIKLALLAGVVGKGAAIDLLDHYKVYESAPTVEEIEKDPKNVRLPDNLGVQFALGLTLANVAQQAKGNGTVDAFATYIARWPDEQARFAFTNLIDKVPRAATSKAYLTWEKSR
jgi:MoxR-like ATPase